MTTSRTFLRLLATAAILLLVGCGGPSNRSAPASPTNVRSVPITDGVRVHWTASGQGIIGFSIERRTLPGEDRDASAVARRTPAAASSTFDKIGDAPKDASYFDDLTTEPGNTYVYRVVAVGKSGSSVPSQQTKPQNAPQPGVDLTLTIVGNGTISVGETGSSDSRSCAAACTLSYAPGTKLVLTPDSSDSQRFAGWTGACEGVDSCTLTLNEPKEVGATFGNKVLSVVLQGDVGVTITISPADSGAGSQVCALEPGQACSVAYQDQVDLNASIQLQTSEAEPGSVAEPFQGCESQSSGDYVFCTLSVPSGRTVVTATVVRPPQAVDDHYEVLEDGSLEIRAPGVLDNDEDSPGDALRAVLDARTNHGALDFDKRGSFRYQPLPDFAGTDSFTYRAKDAYGNVSGTATATISVIPVNDAPVFRITADPPTIKVTSPAQAIQDFAKDIGPGGGTDEKEQGLSFETTWAGSGSLAFSTAPGLALDGTLRYAPAPGTYGKAAVTATLIDDGGTENGGVDRKSRSFTIQVDPMFLDYSTRGGGSLKVVPEPVNGGYARDQIVTLTAVAGAGERFVSWDGACEGPSSTQSTCTVRMTGDLTASATFAKVHTLTVTITPERYRAGSVTSDPPGIDGCTSSCTAVFESGTKVKLKALRTGYWFEFDDWDGACDDTDDEVCTVIMDSDKTVTAQFKGSW